MGDIQKSLSKAMINLVSSLYRTLVPQSFKIKIAYLRREGKAKRRVLKYYSPTKRAGDFEKELAYLRKNDFHNLPYRFVKEYDYRQISVLYDSHCRLPYVMHGDSRMYFPSEMSKEDIRGYYNGILVEQDSRSPHCYLTDGFQISPNTILVDVGAAEGAFTLDHVHEVRSCYLIESDKRWMTPLQHTFRPWSDKVTIINSFVSNTTSKETVCLDDLFETKEIDFLKVDAEGEEIAILEGAIKCLLKKIWMLAICCYHRNEHHDKIHNFLRDRGFTVETSTGYMLFPRDPAWSPPFFRRALVRGWRDHTLS